MGESKKQLRLMAIAKEFNIGRDTLLSFLKTKNVEGVDSFTPNTLLSMDIYKLLQEEFASDKDQKKKSEKVSISSGVASIKITSPVVAPIEESAPVAQTHESASAETTPAMEDTSVSETTSVTQTTKGETQEEAQAQEEQDDSTRITGPKVLGKIDIGDMKPRSRGGASKRGKKSTEDEKPISKAKTTTAKKNKKTNEEKEIAPLFASLTETENVALTPASVADADLTHTETETTQQVASKSKTTSEPSVEAHETKYEKLSGPRVVGKIELPADALEGRGRRKRSRFVVERGGGSGKLEDPAEEKRVARARGGRKKQAAQSGGAREEENVIDEKTIQDKIKETQARLLGGTSSRLLKSTRLKRKNRKKKEADAEEDVERSKVLQVSEFLSLSEFASMMDVNFSEVIAKCMALGLMVSINQRLDAEVMELIAQEYGFEIVFAEAEETRDVEEEEDAEADLHPCPPVVTVMGHVDHGKTSLIDYIRTTNIVAGEAGGITQKIGAYEITLDSGKQLTFLDTPGHEAFTAMRARGTKVADVAVVIIAADDSVMPQTKEAIAHARAAGVPIVFAINKIDKEGANVDRIKEELSQMDILVEDWGGKYQCQEISAKKGLHVDELMEKILLEAELLNLRANPNKAALGTVLDSRLDKGRGYIASVLVQGGTLKVGDVISSGQYFGRVKALFNERGNRIAEALPASPALLLGLNGNPPLGERFRVYEDESEARTIATKRSQIQREQGLRARKHITLDEIGRRLVLGNFKELKMIIKADVDGTVEALADALQQLSTPEVVVNVIHKGVGQIIESDVMLAAASDAIIIAFQVRPSAQAAKLAQNEDVEIKTYSVIYHVIDEIKSAMEGMLQPAIEQKITANIEVKNIFRFDKNTVAGCQVMDGKVAKTNKIRVIREGVVLHTGEMESLRRYKDDVKEVAGGMECGIVIKGFNDVKEGDLMEAFVEEEVKRNL